MLPEGDCRWGNSSCTGSEGNSELLEKSGLATPGPYGLRDVPVVVTVFVPLFLAAALLLLFRLYSGAMQASVSTTAAQSLCDVLSLRRPLLLFFLFLLPLFWMMRVGCCWCCGGCGSRAVPEADACMWWCCPPPASSAGGASSATSGRLPPPPSSMGQQSAGGGGGGGGGWYMHWYCIV